MTLHQIDGCKCFYTQYFTFESVEDQFDISPDGKTIAFDLTRENADIVLIERPPGPS